MDVDISIDEGVGGDEIPDPGGRVHEGADLSTLIARIHDHDTAAGKTLAVDAVEKSLLRLERDRQSKLDKLEEATIVTGELEDKVAAAPHEMKLALQEIRRREQDRVVDSIAQLKVDIKQRGVDLETAGADRVVVLAECNRLREDIAAQHARRHDLATAVEATLGSRIDEQLLCRQLAASLRDTLAQNEARQGDLRHIKRAAELKREEAAKASERNEAAVAEQKRKKQEVFDASVQVRGDVIQTRWRLIKLKRDVQKIHAKFAMAQTDATELEQMLSRFEPGFSETILGRMAELYAEIADAEARLVKARAHCHEHVAKCDKETNEILTEKKKTVQKRQSVVKKKEQKLRRDQQRYNDVEAETRRGYEGLKANMLFAKGEIKAMNTKLMHAEGKCSEMEEELDHAVQIHVANVTAYREQLGSIGRNSDALEKVAIKKETKLAEVQATCNDLHDSLEAHEKTLRDRLRQTVTQTALVQESERRAIKAERVERHQQAKSEEAEACTHASRQALRDEEAAFVVEHTRNMDSAEARIFPARSAGTKARKELQEIEEGVQQLVETRQEAESDLDALTKKREALNNRKISLSHEKVTAKIRAGRAQEMMQEAKTKCRTALLTVQQEHVKVQLEADIASVQHGTAHTLNERLLKSHAKICEDVRIYRDDLIRLECAAANTVEANAALRGRSAAMYREIRGNHAAFLEDTEDAQRAASDEYASKTHRVQSYVKVLRRLHREKARVDLVLRKAHEVKFDMKTILHAT